MEEEDDLSTMIGDAKKPAPIENTQALGKFPIPLASNCSKKILPRPCHNCGSPLHYNRNCASWIKQGHPGGKNTSSSKTNEAYTSSYIAMLENDEDSYDVHCTVYYTLTDNGGTLETEALIVESGLTGETIDRAESIDTPTELHEESSMQKGSSWHALLVNTTELESGSEKPTEGTYEPSPIW
jgi:hypothetical protein